MSKRNSRRYTEWRRKVLQRDNYECQECHDLTKQEKREQRHNLTAHHIKGWAEYPELRYIVKNGITLCREHHNQHHQKGIDKVYKSIVNYNREGSMRDRITKEELQKLYLENTNEEVCNILHISKVTLIKMIKDAGISPKGKGYAQKYIIKE